MIGAAAKIFHNSSPQKCTSYAKALEYAGVLQESMYINEQYGLPQFDSAKDAFKERYKDNAIFDSIPLSVNIENKRSRLLKTLGLPKLPLGSILVGGKKEFNNYGKYLFQFEEDKKLLASFTIIITRSGA